MELEAARRAVLAAVRGTCAADLPRLLHWMRNTSKRGPARCCCPAAGGAPRAGPDGWGRPCGCSGPEARSARESRFRRCGLAAPSRYSAVFFFFTLSRIQDWSKKRYLSLSLSHWFYFPAALNNDFDELVVSNNDVVLKNIAEDLRNRLPIEAMFNSEHQAVQKIHQHPLPMIHVDAFLYDDDFVDSLCEEGKMSRSYCTECGSYKTASLEFISHSFSLMELKFLYQHVLPDLTGKVVVDVGSRLGAVLFAGYLYSSASQLYGVEMNADFCQLQEMMVTKYQFIDRIKVVHADICTEASLLQKADVVVMNNVFEYFLDRQEQARAWEFIAFNVRKRGSLLVTVPSLKESLSKLQTNIQLNQWVEEMQLNYDVYMEKDVDREALEQIHLYRIL
ncbi:uncharacterized protein LOC141742561 isoform X1 [Larus michahellis]|uniref:uncharacterized protein LOC141742561 isoform X1 n=1 Tax=Larus michahellis TaxID=119627 RepID=UPI003D9B2332